MARAKKTYTIRFGRLEWDAFENLWLTADESEVATVEAFDQQDAIQKLRTTHRVASVDWVIAR
jgi:hypothetical protein